VCRRPAAGPVKNAKTVEASRRTNMSSMNNAETAGHSSRPLCWDSLPDIYTCPPIGTPTMKKSLKNQSTACRSRRRNTARNSMGVIPEMIVPARASLWCLGALFLARSERTRPDAHSIAPASIRRTKMPPAASLVEGHVRYRDDQQRDRDDTKGTDEPGHRHTIPAGPHGPDSGPYAGPSRAGLLMAVRLRGLPGSRHET